jgi:hypothetical protein
MKKRIPAIDPAIAEENLTDLYNEALTLQLGRFGMSGVAPRV